MLDGVTLDQVRAFIAAADEGSFSAAGRRLGRAQSVVSQTLANLEGQLGVTLFDRSGRLPVLTDQGRALLAVARAVEGNMDLLKARAKSLAGGLEAELSVAMDIMFPLETFIAAVAAFQRNFPTTLLKFDIGSSAVVRAVLDGRCAIGVVGPWLPTPRQLTCEALLKFRTATVVSPQHPLASHPNPIPPSVLKKHVQLIHIDPADILPAYGARRSPKIWHLSHLGAKFAFLRAGLGFGGLPLHMLEKDLASGALVQITLEDRPPNDRLLTMSATYRTDSPPGPAGRWFIERLKREDVTRSKERGAVEGDEPNRDASTAPLSSARKRSNIRRMSMLRAGHFRGSH
jgi:DNA-binding transcriptional LysR family regulator